MENLAKNNNSDISMEACAWVAQIETGELTTEDLAAFREWICRSPAHQKEIQRIAQLSSELNVLTDMAPALTAAVAQRNELVKKPAKKSWLPITSVFASVVLMFGLYFSNILNSEQDPTVNSPLIYATEIGNHQKITLADGSTVQLNTNSIIEVDFSTERRKIRLLKGEAYFEVAHNSQRPFFVYAGEQSVRAVGTAFLVRHLTKQFELTVTEGRVELIKVATTANSTQSNLINNSLAVSKVSTDKIFLNAGESIVYQDTLAKTINTITPGDIMRKLSWQEGLLDFSDAPLSEVIADLSRYTTSSIKIVDPELRDLKFGGLFRISEIDSLFDALESNFNIVVEHDSNGSILLKRKAS